MSPLLFLRVLERESLSESESRVAPWRVTVVLLSQTAMSGSAMPIPMILDILADFMMLPF